VQWKYPLFETSDHDPAAIKKPATRALPGLDVREYVRVFVPGEMLTKEAIIEKVKNHTNRGRGAVISGFKNAQEQGVFYEMKSPRPGTQPLIIYGIKK
jgi:hypothetical protein